MTSLFRMYSPSVVPRVAASSEILPLFKCALAGFGSASIINVTLLALTISSVVNLQGAASFSRVQFSPLGQLACHIISLYMQVMQYACVVSTLQIVPYSGVKSMKHFMHWFLLSCCSASARSTSPISISVSEASSSSANRSNFRCLIFRLISAFRPLRSTSHHSKSKHVRIRK